MAFTKEQLISRARENIGYYADLIERLSKEGDDCKIILETIRMDLELMQIALVSLEESCEVPMNNIDKHAVQAVADLKAGYTLGHADVAILNELARIALASLEAEPVKNGWISCSERMPEQFKTVLAYTKFGEIWTGTYDPHWDFYCDNIIVEGVTHWMPIPELPGESNDKE